MDQEKLYLHAVVVKKPSTVALARYKAQKFIRNKKKTFYRETEDSYRFRNIPKQLFKDFVTKKIDDDISLVLGHLNAKGLGQNDMEAK
jgi:hypothetical protein